MENRQSVENESAKVNDQSLAEDISPQRAQKRLATQSERDEMATFSTSPSAVLPKTPQVQERNNETL